MKAAVVTLLALLACIALVVLMKVRGREYEKVQRRNKIQDIKLRVTNDVLVEYHSAIAEEHNQLEKTINNQKTVEKEVANLQVTDDGIKKEVNLCQESTKSDAEKLAGMAVDLDNLKDETEKEVTLWNTELAELKKQMELSSLCDFLKEGPSNGRKLCGDKEPDKAEKEKADAHKKEEGKAEAPNQEQPKADTHKKEEGKAEAPNQEQPKADAKQEEEVKA